MKPTFLFQTCGLALCLALGACGGSGDPSRASYIRQANAICAAASGKIQVIGRPGTEINAVERAAISQLAALKRPAGDGKKLADEYRAARDAVDLGDEAIAAAARGDEAGAQQARAESLSFLAKANRAAETYGMTECAK